MTVFLRREPTVFFSPNTVSRVVDTLLFLLAFHSVMIVMRSYPSCESRCVRGVGAPYGVDFLSPVPDVVNFLSVSIALGQ